jgi:hypothetical protein
MQRDQLWYEGDKSYLQIRVWMKNGKADEIETIERRHDWRPF